MPRRVCPVCSTRYAQLVEPDCAVCKGVGYLILGEAALSLYAPAIVSTAVAVALEAVARVTDLTLTLGDDRAGPVRATVEEMTAAGVLAKPPAAGAETQPVRPVTTRPRKRGADGKFALEVEPTEYARSLVQEAILPIDQVLIESEGYMYDETDRPNARGLPLLSANGHPSHLARVCDPVRIFDKDHHDDDTRAVARQHHQDRNHAEALALAVPEAAARRTNRKRS